MELFEGKKGIIFGIRDEGSITWSIVQELHAQGAQMGITYLRHRYPDRPGKAEGRAQWLGKQIEAKFVLPCDGTQDDEIDEVFSTARDVFGSLDFVVCSLAYGRPSDLRDAVSNVSREGFQLAMNHSVYGLIAIARRAKPLMKSGGSILVTTFIGSERVFPGANLMGICKAALVGTVRALAEELGPDGVRVNALSVGMPRTPVLCDGPPSC